MNQPQAGTLKKTNDAEINDWQAFNEVAAARVARGAQNEKYSFFFVCAFSILFEPSARCKTALDKKDQKH